MTNAYHDAVLQAELLADHVDPTPEHLVALGYRAALQDVAVAIESIGVDGEYAQEQSSRGAAARGKITAKRIATEKLASIARKSENRAKELKV